MSDLKELAPDNVTPLYQHTLQPLLVDTEPNPYPLNSLPVLLQNAVREVEDYTQANTALIASNALGVLAVACQGLAKVRIDANLIQPLSLYLLTIAAPNERKTSIENYFVSAIRIFELEQSKILEPLWQQHRSNKESFEAEIKGIKQSIQKLAKDGDSTDAEKQRLLEIEKERPTAPLFVQMRYNDTNQQALLNGLATKYPTAAIMTSEGGTFFGGASFNSDSTLSGFGMFNELWSDSGYTISRKGEGDTHLSEIALSLSIAVQPDVLEAFVNRTRSVVRGSGFFARCLFSHPQSTIGTRLYKEPPDSMVLVNAFNNRIGALLDELPNHITEDFKLKRTLINLSPEAKSVWIQFNDYIEKEQQFDGELEAISDIAGKAANNAARIACLFHLIDNGLEEHVSELHMINACEIVSWHLEEAKRYFGRTELPQDIQDAEMQLEYLIKRFQRKGKTSITLDELRKNGRGGKEGRSTKRIRAALNVLTRQHILISQENDHERTYHLNPSYLDSRGRS